MDVIDGKIICELDNNCREPISKMAKKLRIGRNVLAYRINKLEEQGIITDYICSINLGKLGYKTYKIYCKISKANERDERDFVNFLVDHKQVIHLLKTEGSYDYAFVIAVKDIRELDGFLTELKDKFRNLLEDSFVSIVVYSRIFKISKLLLGDKEKIIKFEKYNENSDEIKLDEKDIKILEIISKNANLSVVDISLRTKLSIDIVKYRIKELTKNLITSYRALPNMNKLGYFHYVILLKIKNSSSKDEHKLVDWCANRRNILYCTKRIGFFDFEINAAITDINDLNDTLADLKKNFAGIISNYELIINSKKIKLNYFPL